jgi:hypothetical protein
MSKTNNDSDSDKVLLDDAAQEVKKTKKIVDLKVMVFC